MNVAILGASSQIAQDLLRQWALFNRPNKLSLFARNTGLLNKLVDTFNNSQNISIHHLNMFSSTIEKFDAVINFIGVGNPSQAAEYANEIMSITNYYDDIVLSYLSDNPKCKYIFLSSGAVYGNSFSEQPVDKDSASSIAINNITVQDFYSVAKLYSEVKHRASIKNSIVDIRVFNIFSRTQDLNARFFITDIIRAIRDKTKLIVSPDAMIRDFLHPEDFRQLIDIILNINENINLAIDCYSKEPIDKFVLLSDLQARYELDWDIDKNVPIINATGIKKNYYSTNKIAESIGYKPRYSSLETICVEIDALKNNNYISL